MVRSSFGMPKINKGNSLKWRFLKTVAQRFALVNESLVMCSRIFPLYGTLLWFAVGMAFGSHRTLLWWIRFA